MPSLFASYLRVYEPLTAFDRDRQSYWRRYVSEGRAIAPLEGPVRQRTAVIEALGAGWTRLPDLPDEAYVLESDDALLVCPWNLRIRVAEAALSARDGVPSVLADAFVPAPDQDPPVQENLRDTPHLGLDLTLSVQWNGERVAEPPFAGMYWTPAQQLAHLTVNGASLRTGDLYASGTVSGPERGQVGSFLELTWGGSEPVKFADGSERTFLEDGDTVTITATAPGPDGTTVALGEVTGTILPAR